MSARNVYQWGKGHTTYTILLAAGSRDAKANPTLVAGDVKISKDGGAFANLASLPTVSPSGGIQVKIVLSAAETEAKQIMIRFDDVSGAEWEEQTLILEAADPRNGLVEWTPEGFAERPGVVSGRITRASYPNYGAIFTTATSPVPTDFNPDVLCGAVIYHPDTGKSFLVLGGYYFDDSTDTLSNVFGIASDSDAFGCKDGAGTTIDTNWTGSDINEPGNGSGWTFIVVDPKYGFTGLDSGEALEVWISPSTWTGSVGLTAQEVRDAMKLAPSAGVPESGSVDDRFNTVNVDLLEVTTGIAAVRAVLGTPSDLGGGATVADNLVDIDSAVDAVVTLDEFKDLMFERNVVSRHANEKPATYRAGTGGNQITVQTTQDGNGNTETEAIV